MTHGGLSLRIERQVDAMHMQGLPRQRDSLFERILRASESHTTCCRVVIGANTSGHGDFPYFPRAPIPHPALEQLFATNRHELWALVSACARSSFALALLVESSTDLHSGALATARGHSLSDWPSLNCAL